MPGRRAAAVAALAIVIGATVGVVAANLGGSSGGRRHPRGATAPAGATTPAGEVRNATPQPNWRPHTGPVPILEYHVLGPAPEGAPYRSCT